MSLTARFLIAVLAGWLVLGPGPLVAQTPECEGDLDGDGTVTISELIRAVRSAIEGCPLSNCPGI